MEKFLEGYSYGVSNPNGTTAPLSTVSSQNNLFTLFILAAVILAAVTLYVNYRMKKSENETKQLTEQLKALASMKSARYQAMGNIEASSIRAAALAKAKGNDKAVSRIVASNQSIKDYDRDIAEIMSLRDAGFDKNETDALLKELAALQCEEGDN